MKANIVLQPTFIQSIYWVITYALPNCPPPLLTIFPPALPPNLKAKHLPCPWWEFWNFEIWYVTDCFSDVAYANLLLHVAGTTPLWWSTYRTFNQEIVLGVKGSARRVAKQRNEGSAENVWVLWCWWPLGTVEIYYCEYTSILNIVRKLCYYCMICSGMSSSSLLLIRCNHNMIYYIKQYVYNATVFSSLQKWLEVYEWWQRVNK